MARSGDEPCTYFQTYGYFDLVAVRCIDHLNSSYLVLLHPKVTESAPFRFFPDHKTSKEQFRATLNTWKIGIAVVAKIYGWNAPSKGSERWEVAQIIQNKFPDTFVFSGLGFSELLFLAGDDDVAKLLRYISQLRSLTAPGSTTRALFSKTTTFPFVSCSVIENQRYNEIKGTVDPVVTVSCSPPSERGIAAAVRDQGIIAKNIYGKNDLLLAWPNQISIADLAKFVVTLRNDWGAAGAVRKTTTYLETPIDESASTIVPDRLQATEFISATDEEDLFAKLRAVTPYVLRAGLSDLILRLMTCLRDPQLADYYCDMVNTLEFVDDLLGQINSTNELVAKEAQAAAARIAHTARAAITQRYAALELHPETLAHSYSPLLCDIRTLVAAATCIPHFIFDNLLSGKRASETWAGFVLFGGAYSPQWYDQHVLALPLAALFNPIAEWWKLTHEAAHAIYYTLFVAEKVDPPIYDYVRSADANVDLSARHIIGEQFANWFDWRYIFKRNTKLYLGLVWQAWLDQPLVWQSKPQYLARTFAVLLCENLSALAHVALLSREAGIMPLLKTWWFDFVEMTKSVPRMEIFLKELAPSESNEIFNMVSSLLPLLRWFEQKFETKCGVLGLSERLSPSYPDLSKHVGELKAGRVVLSGIADPVQLQLALLEELGNTQASISTEIAYIYSLQQCYSLQRR